MSSRMVNAYFCRQVKELIEDGRTRNEISDILECSLQTISRVIKYNFSAVKYEKYLADEREKDMKRRGVAVKKVESITSTSESGQIRRLFAEVGELRKFNYDVKAKLLEASSSIKILRKELYWLSFFFMISVAIFVLTK